MAKTASFHRKVPHSGLWVVTENDRTWTAVQKFDGTWLIQNERKQHLDREGPNGGDVVAAIERAHASRKGPRS